MKYIVPLFITALSIAACNNNASETSISKTAAKDSTPVDQVFFPVPDYIGGQVRIIIDSLKLPISKTVTINGKEQLSRATDQEFRDLAQFFRQPDISDPSIKNFYTQTNIADQSAPSVTLIFTASNPALEIQKINVYLKPDPVQNEQVTGIYIEKIFSKADTSFNQKLYWKTGKNMQVVTEKNVNGKALPVEQTKITWDY